MGRMPMYRYSAILGLAALALSSCTLAWVPENMPVLIAPGTENAVPRSGSFALPKMDETASLEEFDVAMAVATQLQPAMAMVALPDPTDYYVTTSFARQPASVKLLQNGKNITRDIGPRAPFGCRRDIAMLDVVITRVRTGERVYSGRARQILCQGANYDADSSALAKAALQLP